MKLSEAAFADLLGVSRGTVQQWENGTTAPSRKRQPAVAKLLGITVAQLMGEGSSAQTTTNDEEMPLTNAITVIATRLNTMSSEQRTKAADQLKVLAMAPDSQKARDALMGTLTQAEHQERRAA